MLYEEKDILEFNNIRLKLFSDGTLQLRLYEKDIASKADGFVRAEDDLAWRDSEHIFDVKEAVLDVKPLSVLTDEEIQEKRKRFDNVNRTKKLVADIIHENYDVWQSFITLTFKENITDINAGNKMFNQYISQVRRVMPDFKYVCCPEFQKRGAVHYHILTNIRCGSVLLPDREPIRTKSIKNKYYWIKNYDIKYWDRDKRGFSSAFPIKIMDDYKAITSYVTKYLLKEFDSRLYGHNKILHSNNLNMPVCNKISTESNVYKSVISNILLKYDFEYFEFIPSGGYQLAYQEISCLIDDEDASIIRYLLCNKNVVESF